MALSDIDTIIVVMLENRSFDHMLGYLSLETTPDRMQVDGLSNDEAWRARYANTYKGKDYKPRRLSPDQQIDDDPGHSFQAIAEQIETPPKGPGATRMGGFALNFAKPKAEGDPDRGDPQVPMSYYDQESVPIIDFLARNFTVCDRWFAALPCGTQPNRLMAMAGYSKLLNNHGFPMRDHKLVYDWFKPNRVDWCVYLWGRFVPFFAFMPGWALKMLPSLNRSQRGATGKHDRYRRYARFKQEWMSPDPFPSVVFIEPGYSEGPSKSANDDHPPTGVARGQAFVADIYTTLIRNPARWAKTLMIVTYDEHGGFFDHVPPIAMPPLVIEDQEVTTTGVRVPALIVSPQVPKGHVFSRPLDHTSILQLLVDRFTPAAGYSEAVNARHAAGRLDRILNILQPPEADPRRPEIPPDVLEAINGAARGAPDTGPNGADADDPPTARAMFQAVQQVKAETPSLLREPGWEDLNAYLDAHPVPPVGPAPAPPPAP